MKTTFWGVRGSIATSGPTFAGFGGNTTCLELEHEGHRLIIDAGTGIRALGERLLKEAPRGPVHLFFTHLHWDHIQGFPFFGPAYVPGGELYLYGPASESGTLEESLRAQMQPPNFPVGLDAMAADKRFATIASGDALEVGPFSVTAEALSHPQGSLGYRVEAGGKRVCFATDTEHGPELDEAILRLGHDVDLLIHDAQYTEDEYAGRRGPPRKGWGHSTYVAATEIARAVGAKGLALFHHDPTHDDDAMAAIERDAATYFPGAFAAREGRPITL